MLENFFSPQEAIYKAPVRNKFNPGHFDGGNIDDAIYQYLRPFLGATLFDAMVQDKRAFVAWDASAKYAVGTYVFCGLNGKYYQRANALGNENPLADASNWTVVTPFADNDYNNLWSNGAWVICAYAICKDAIPFIWAQIATNGLVKGKGENHESTSASEMNMLRASIEDKINVQRQILHDYICKVRKADATKYTTYVNKCEGCEDAQIHSAPQNFGVFMYENDCKDGCE